MLTDTRRRHITWHVTTRHIFLTVLSSEMAHITHVTLYFWYIYLHIYIHIYYIYTYIYIHIYIYIIFKKISVTCVTCTILLKSMQKHSVTWYVTCRVTCVTCWFLDVKVFFGEKSTCNLESHKFLSQVLASARPIIVYCY